MARGMRFRRRMTLKEAIHALASGNREAERICDELFHRGPCIDPDDIAGGWGPLRDLDGLNIRKDRIVKLYRDVCGEDLTSMIAVLRAWQQCLDVVSQDDIYRAIEHRGSLDLAVIKEAVQAELPNFNRA